jgi:hypothetical protein
LLRAFLLEGQPEFRSFVSFLIFAIIPAKIRQSLRKGMHRARRQVDAEPGLRLVFSRKPAVPALRKSSL